MPNEAERWPMDGTDSLALLYWRRDGYKIAFTNGVFDLFHIGHDHLLRGIHHELRHEKLKLVVAVNSDDSVARFKPGRPIHGLDLRMNMLASHRLVDVVMPFSDPTPLKAVELVKPDYLIKGADYRGGPIVGDEFVRARGGEVIFIPELVGALARTTTLIERLKEL